MKVCRQCTQKVSDETMIRHGQKFYCPDCKTELSELGRETAFLSTQGQDIKVDDPNEAISNLTGKSEFIETKPVDPILVAMEDRLKADPFDKEALFHLGTWYKSQHEFSKAVRRFKKLLQKYPKDFETHRHLADCLVALDQLEPAIIILNRMVKLAPENPFVKLNLGIAYIQKGDTPKAQDVLDQLIQESSDPDIQSKAQKLLASIG